MHSYQISIPSPVHSTLLGDPAARKCHLCLKFLQPVNHSPSRHRQRKIQSLHSDSRNLRFYSRKRSLLFDNVVKDVILMGKYKGAPMQVTRANRGFNFGGGGGWGDSNTKRVLGNLALAIGLTYLSTTDQLGWILDALVSLWLLVLILPVLGLAAFIWFAGRDIVQDSCPNCGNVFQILKSTLKEEGVQLCPYCAQPFSVENNKFVRESTRFSSDPSSNFGQVFNGFSSRSKKEKSPAGTIVDIEAEVKDID